MSPPHLPLSLSPPPSALKKLRRIRESQLIVTRWGKQQFLIKVKAPIGKKHTFVHLPPSPTPPLSTWSEYLISGLKRLLTLVSGPTSKHNPILISIHFFLFFFLFLVPRKLSKSSSIFSWRVRFPHLSGSVLSTASTPFFLLTLTLLNSLARVEFLSSFIFLVSSCFFPPL